MEMLMEPQERHGYVVPRADGTRADCPASEMFDIRSCAICMAELAYEEQQEELRTKADRLRAVAALYNNPDRHGHVVPLPNGGRMRCMSFPRCPTCWDELRQLMLADSSLVTVDYQLPPPPRNEDMSIEQEPVYRLVDLVSESADKRLKIPSRAGLPKDAKSIINAAIKESRATGDVGLIEVAVNSCRRLDLTEKQLDTLDRILKFCNEMRERLGGGDPENRMRFLGRNIYNPRRGPRPIRVPMDGGFHMGMPHGGPGGYGPGRPGGPGGPPPGPPMGAGGVPPGTPIPPK